MLSTVDVYAAGTTGEETMEVRLYDRVLATFENVGGDAKRGQWTIGFPAQTGSGGNVFQIGSGSVGNRALVTGLSAGSGIGSFDVDGGVTSALSPEIVLAAGSTHQLNVTYNFAHTSSATDDDQLRVGILVNGEVVNVFQIGGSGATRTGEWESISTSLEDFADNTIQILVEAEDASNTVLEAAIGSIVIETVS